MRHLFEAVRTARKQHQCALCAQPILAGWRYLCETLTSDGRIYDFKTHLACGPIAMEAGLCDPHEGWLVEDILADELHRIELSRAQIVAIVQGMPEEELDRAMRMVGMEG